MTGRVVSGDEAMACGALSAGVTFVTSYPGSPSSGTVSRLRGLTDEQDLYVEWCANEKIAMEMGIGASIGGRRALVCVKSVGMNVMVDPLMTLKLTPVHGGLVILLGDDPGGYGSQNDQDTRPGVFAADAHARTCDSGRSVPHDARCLRNLGAVQHRCHPT